MSTASLMHQSAAFNPVDCVSFDTGSCRPCLRCRPSLPVHREECRRQTLPTGQTIIRAIEKKADRRFPVPSKRHFAGQKFYVFQPAFVVGACSGRRFSERVVILDVSSQEPPDRLAAESGSRGATTPGSLDTANGSCDAT